MRYRPHHISPNLETAHVVLVWKNFAGPHQSSLVGLGVTMLATVRTLRRNGIWAEGWGCTSFQHLFDRLRQAQEDAQRTGQLPISHLDIAAPWLKTEELELLASEFPETVFAVSCHSNWPFLQADPDAVARMREIVLLQQSTTNVYLAANSAKLSESASEIWRANVLFLPNLYDVSESPLLCRRPWREGDPLNIGLMGAIRPLKNPLAGAAAAVELAVRLRVPTKLYLSASRDDHST
jgi:hypothetical protein